MKAVQMMRGVNATNELSVSILIMLPYFKDSLLKLYILKYMVHLIDLQSNRFRKLHNLSLSLPYRIGKDII